MPSEVTHTVPGGYECDMAVTPKGWVMAAVRLDPVDDRFVRNMDIDVEWERAKALLRPGVTQQEWTAAFVSLRADLRLTENRDGAVRTLHRDSAEQFSGVAACGGGDPAFVWTALDGGRWSVNLYERGDSRQLQSGPQVAISPAVARDAGGGLWCAWVTRDSGGEVMHLADLSQDRQWDIPGRSPSLAAAGGAMCVCFERISGQESRVHFICVSDGSLGEPVEVPSRDPLNFRPRCIVGPDGGLLVTWESTPAWGYDIRVDQVRHIWLKHIDAETGLVTDGHGTESSGGALPIPVRVLHAAQW